MLSARHEGLRFKALNFKKHLFEGNPTPISAVNNN